MRLAWLTDIHLDFLEPPELTRLGEEIAASKADAALVTGDIAIARETVPRLGVVAAAAGMPVWFVLGNHDFYGGSVDGVRSDMEACEEPLRYIPQQAPVELAPGAWMVGCDGWGDARLGAPETSRVVLNDFIHIADLCEAPDLTAKLRRLGAAEANILRAQLKRVPAGVKLILIATHIPPFEGACWHEGKISNADWLPFFTCDAVGKVIEQAATSRPDSRFLVLCGHTHSAGTVKVLPNLEVWTGAADYGAPRVDRVLEIGS